MKKASRSLEAKRARRIWSKHNGPIPIDESGVTFDIHHRDGDWHNNDPVNLLALSVLEHYRVHLAQGDWAAAWYISKRLKLSSADYEHIRQKISTALKGRVMSPEWCSRISQALSGRKVDRSTVEKQRIANAGRKHSPEFGQAITRRQLGTKASEDARLNMSAAHRGKTASVETRVKMSLSRKGKCRDPEATRRMIATRLANGSYGRGKRSKFASEIGF